MQNDYEAIQRIKDAFVESVEKISTENPELFESDRFGAWATSALLDLLCASAKAVGLNKELVVLALDDSWKRIAGSVLN